MGYHDVNKKEVEFEGHKTVEVEYGENGEMPQTISSQKE